MVCPICRSPDIEMTTVSKMGLAYKLSLTCSECKKEVWSKYTSPRVDLENTKRFDINARTVLASKECGINFSNLEKFFSILNTPPPMNHKTYNTISLEVRDAAVNSSVECMKACANLISDRYKSGEYLNDQSCSSPHPVVIVSSDGTWQKRGHSSHNGVGALIEINSGFVIDAEVVSNFCRECNSAPAADSQDYVAWREKHLPMCKKNFNGSANAMEMEAAGIMFSRSEAERGLVYGTMLCDGDSKALKRVNDLDLYGDLVVVKEDCINHISKRMHTALTKLKQSNKAQLNYKFTQDNIEKLSNTYATNLKKAAPDIEKMRKAVLSGFFHSISSDEEPNHVFCPEGPDSWCKFQRAKFANVAPPPHKPDFSAEVGRLVYPIFQRLSEPELLQRCSRMATQNANESFNALIWKRAPKTEFSSLPSVQTATALAVLAFNAGPVGLKPVMERLGLHWNKASEVYGLQTISKKFRIMKNKVKGLSKWKRKNLQRQRRIKEDRQKNLEGETYSAGLMDN